MSCSFNEITVKVESIMTVPNGTNDELQTTKKKVRPTYPPPKEKPSISQKAT